jgi:DNA repair exonuclease SbcCD ATPase subunit
MDTPEDRLTLLERAQLLHDATLRRHGEILDRHEDALARHADHMAHLEILMEQQLENQTTLREIAERLTQRQDQHDEVMRHLAQTLDAIKDLLDRGNGH